MLQIHNVKEVNMVYLKLIYNHNVNSNSILITKQFKTTREYVKK